MKNFILTLLAVLYGAFAFSQKVSITGSVVDSAGTALPYSTVSILYPADSTLAFFGITNGDGAFKIDQVVPGNYVLQASYLGFASHYQDLLEGQLAQDLNLGPVVLQLKAVSLAGVEITGRQAPILIKSDTIEYNASSFRSKPTDNVESLLKRMPGIEVDREGNIKAQGEDVEKVTVDGEEFFGDDPKMATKNLPADAVKKVQVFDKKSDAAEFTGVDDGQRTKTINLELKEDKKKGTFGDVKAGYGTDNRYEFAGSAFKYNKKLQLSALGRLNNINDYGFSISDYLNFNGVGGMGGGNFNIRISSDDNSIPLNIGQAQYGDLLSGAGGLNGVYKFSKDNTLNFSYLFNGSDRTTTTQTASTQFTPNGSFNIDENSIQDNDNTSHLGTLRWKNDVDSLTRVIVTGKANTTNAGSNSISFRQTTDELAAPISSFNRDLNASANGFSLEGTGTLIRKSAKKSGRNVSGVVSVAASESTDGTNWENSIQLPNQGVVDERFFRSDQENGQSIKVQGKWNEPLTSSTFLELGAQVFLAENNIFRDQTREATEQNTLVNPSESAGQEITEYQGQVSWKWNTRKSSFSVGANGQYLSLNQSYFLGDTTAANSNQPYTYLLPSVRFRHEIKKGTRLSFRYSSEANYAGIGQVSPFVDLSNPLFIQQGNLDLEPEVAHSGNLFFMLYDAFSFTSVFANMRMTYTENAIVQSKTITPELVQFTQPLNFKDQLSIGSGLSFSTPIKKLGITASIDLNEDYTKGYSIINGSENQLKSNTHAVEFSISNRKKEHFDVTVGTAFSLTENRYSLQTNQNNDYYRNNYFADAAYFWKDKWVISTSFEYQLYRNTQINNTVAIPLWTAEITRNFLEGNRGSLTLKVFDILKKNQGVEQFASENYISQQVSNVLQQYAMLSFTYKLSKGTKPGGDIDVHVKRR